MMVIRMQWLLMGLILIGFCFGAAVNPNAVHSESAPAELLASVGDQTITAEAFQAAMARSPRKYTDPGQKGALLEKMVRFEVLYAAARKAGYDQDPKIIESFRRLMANKYRRDVLAPRLEKVQVTDKEIEKYYRAHQDEFTVAKKVRAAVIRISVPARVSDEKKAQLAQRAETARTEALELEPATRSFGPVAVRYSDHQPTRYRGGDTGWMAAGKNDSRWRIEVNQAILALTEPGKVSPVITTADGHYIVKLMETRESAPKQLTAVKEQIRHQLYNHKRARVEHEFYRELKTTVPVRVDQARLATIELPGGAGNNNKMPPALPGQ
jgi:parvulin-like peptidyl-prolyl isomerase